MNEIRTMLDAREKFLLKLKSEKEKRLKKVPEGSLRINQKGNKTEYYHRTEPKNWSGKYIRKENMSLAKQLAQKDYDEKVLRASEKELQAIQKFNQIYPLQNAEQIYENLHPARQKLVTPIIETDEQFIKKWESVEYEHKGFPLNYPEYYTNKGERVRSKSEILIADALEKAGVPYRYEYPLYVKEIGQTHPDFLALNVRTRKEIFWNHLGMLDDSKYAEDNVWKINQYLKAGYYPGDNMILTYETKENPLNQKIVKQMIEHYLK